MTIARAFRILLKNYKTIKSPKEYASMMNISIGYLIDTVKMVTGQNVSNSIQQVSINEAKHLLYHSALSIKEITQKVGFDDPQYFSRIFSKITGEVSKKTSFIVNP